MYRLTVEGGEYYNFCEADDWHELEDVVHLGLIEALDLEGTFQDDPRPAVVKDALAALDPNSGGTTTVRGVTVTVSVHERSILLEDS